MKKSSLLKMKNLPATEEMLAVAREDKGKAKSVTPSLIYY